MTVRHPFLTVFAACTVLSLAVLPLSAATFGNFRYRDNGASITIARWLGTGDPETLPGVAVILAAIDGKPVTRIGYNAFYGSGLKSVTIPSSVKSSGRSAFS